MAAEQETQDWSSQPRLWTAITDIATQVGDLETEWDQEKLEEKLRGYFRRSFKNVDQNSGKSWWDKIHEYADYLFNSLSAGLGDREWFQQIDWTVCFELAVKENFHRKMYQRVPQAQFEECIAEAVDRALDEVRYSNNRWKTISNVISGAKTVKRVQNAVDTARSEVRDTKPLNLEDFMKGWVLGTYKILAAELGDPRSALEEQQAVEMFEALTQDNCLPQVLIDVEGMPAAGWQVVPDAVAEALAQYPADDGSMPAAAPKKKRKKAWGGDDDWEADSWGAGAGAGYGQQWGGMGLMGKGWGGKGLGGKGLGGGKGAGGKGKGSGAFAWGDGGDSYGAGAYGGMMGRGAMGGVKKPRMM